MSNHTISDVYAELIGSLKDLRAGKIQIQTAEAMYKGANAIANLVAAETNLIKAAGRAVGSGFVPEEVDPFEKDIPQYAVEGMRDCSFCLVESVVRPDAPTVNTLTACDACLKMPSTIHFRRQLELQKTTNTKESPAKGARLTEKHHEILDYLKANDGQATIGAMFGESKQRTITQLMRLEELHYIECIQRPVYQNDFPVERRGKVTSEELHCGIWKITKAGMKAAA